jgi:acetyl-CoA carboxylase biotin carboxylase subunit
MFHKILIANRGEIAVRVARACRDMGISPVAVYSEADRDALHVRHADEAYYVGPAPSAESYLRFERIIEIAKQCGAEAIHPGYGFLSENANFVRACAEAGLVFIGPGADAMEALGEKISARRVALAADVPVVPGLNDPVESFETAREIAANIGYPVMIKASAGGGGKGMRLVFDESELKSAVATAQSEAAASFGNPEVFIEKAVTRPRHIEIQVFADTQGNCVYLGERECSLQRRHQKVIEEAPSPLNDTGLRRRMGEAAVRCARAVNYVGAGTVEFLYSDDTQEFYFLEMNTRLQVEHPVTELVTGIDLVREQIRVAAGLPLSFTQDEIVLRGHAIECRVYAEDPEQNFMPSPGKITALRLPHGPGVRDDGGVYEGAEVTIYYDPMISKLCVWGRDRAEAVDRMRRALDEYAVGGIKTTLPFFREVVRDEEFIQAKLDTGFIARFFARRAAAASKEDIERQDLAVIAAALAYEEQNAQATPAAPENIESRWKIAGRRALQARL